MNTRTMNSRTSAKAIVVLIVLSLLAACQERAGPPTTGILSQPTDQSVVAGTTADFNVVARNATSYQWQRSTDGGTTFTNVDGATANNHTTPVTTLADSGTQYRVVITGTSNVTSSAATLTVTAVVMAPGITVQPTNQAITEGQNTSFAVTAGGTSLSYQWQRSTDGGVNFTNVAGASNATLPLTAVPLADNGHRFRVLVSNSVGSVTSNAALLTVNPAQAIPAFTTQPANQSVVATSTATFDVVATGTPAPTLQWQSSTNAGGSFADIAGATASSYTTPATGAGDNGNQYRVIATNSAGATTSNAATLTVTVLSAPSFTTQPSNATVTEGQNAQFTVAVSGTPTPTLQWQLSTDSGGNWSNITGATGTVYDVIGAARANNGRQFRAVATNDSGSVTSNAAVLTVNAVPAPTVPPASGKIAVGPFHTCAVKADATVACWGHGSSREVLPGSLSDQWTPQTVPGLTGIVQVAVGFQESCAIDSAGTLSCWGKGGALTVINNSGTNYTGVKAVAMGYAHRCFIDANSIVRCWGDNSLGQLGQGYKSSSYVADPVYVLRPNTLPVSAVSLAAGDNHTCALTTDSDVICWGQGAIGDGSPVLDGQTFLGAQSSLSAVFSALTGATAIGSGAHHACAVMAAGGVRCWGYNGFSQLGNRNTTNQIAPVDVIDLSMLLDGVTAIAARSGNTCAVPASGKVVCWGAVAPNSLNGINTISPTGQGTLTQKVTALASGWNHSCALVADGSMECWGDNQYGQLGLGNFTAVNTGGPTPPSTSVIGGAVFWK